MEINILIDKGLEQCPTAAWLKKVIKQVLDAQDASSNIELSLVITGQERVQQLNRDYRGKDKPTDVLSFAMSSNEDAATDVPAFVLPPDSMQHLGEVIISCPQAALQAMKHNHSINTEIVILIIHGVLHLLGYDHEKAKEQVVMEARERDILSHFTLV